MSGIGAGTDPKSSIRIAGIERTLPKSTQSPAIGSVLPRATKEAQAYRTKLGCMLNGDSSTLLGGELGKKLEGRVDLILTSPPFPLNTKKKYGNLNGEAYLEWLSSFGEVFAKLLSPTGSLVVELGNAWERGKPVMSTLALRALLNLTEKNKFHLCQQFVCFNPARLPSPAQWVTVERIRVKDAYTNIWWLSKAMKPEADNRRVLQPYSAAMKRLLERGKYNAGRRPSQHRIGKDSFLEDHGGSIPSNVLTASNTGSADAYHRYCRANGLAPHPARMQEEVVEFFVSFLTKPRALVFDPFAGSNTTGACCERLGRQWLSIELDKDFIRGSRGRFTKKEKP